MSRAGLQSICFVNGQTTCKGGGSGGEKKVFPLNTIKSSAVKLFSVPKAIYILDRWRNFLISRLSPHSASIYQKIFPATSLIIPSLIICIISWVHYCQRARTHTHTFTYAHTPAPAAEAAPIQGLALEQRSICKYEKAHLHKSVYRNVGNICLSLILSSWLLLLFHFWKFFFSSLYPNLVFCQRGHRKANYHSQ